MIVLPLVADASVGPMRADQGVLVTYEDKDWLVTETGRHAIDLSDRAVTSAVGIPVTAKATPDLGGPVQRAARTPGPWQLPQVPAAGAPNTLGLPANLVIGSVFQTRDRRGRAEVRRAAGRRGEGQRHHRGRVARHELLRADLAAVGGVQRGRQDRRAGLRLTAAGQAARDPAARGRAHPVLVVATRAGRPVAEDHRDHRPAPADRRRRR